MKKISSFDRIAVSIHIFILEQKINRWESEIRTKFCYMGAVVKKIWHNNNLKSRYKSIELYYRRYVHLDAAHLGYQNISSQVVCGSQARSWTTFWTREFVPSCKSSCRYFYYPFVHFFHPQIAIIGN